VRRRRAACVSPASSAATGKRRSDLEGLQWLDAALDGAGDDTPLTDRARARLHHAAQLSLRNQGAAAIDGLQTALALFTEADDHAGMSEALCSLANDVGMFDGDVAGERRYAEQACRQARIAGDDHLLGRALGRLAVVSGDAREALLEQAAGLLIPLGDIREVTRAYSTAAYVALTEDRLQEAITLLEKVSMKLRPSLGSPTR
jgi:hypothetical protein